MDLLTNAYSTDSDDDDELEPESEPEPEPKRRRDVLMHPPKRPRSGSYQYEPLPVVRRPYSAPKTETLFTSRYVSKRERALAVASAPRVRGPKTETLVTSRYVSKRERALAVTSAPRVRGPNPHAPVTTTPVVGSISNSKLPHNILASWKRQKTGEHTMPSQISERPSVAFGGHSKAVNAVQWSTTHGMSFSRGRGTTRPQSGRGGGPLTAQNTSTKQVDWPASSSQSQKTMKISVMEGFPEFFQKSVTEQIIPLEKADLKSMQDPNWIAQRYLESYSKFPIKNGRGHLIYEAILEDTASVSFSHFKKPKQYSKLLIAYSKALIMKVLKSSDWGSNPNESRRLPSTHHEYNYWDYIDAWNYAFYYQNPQRKHTWFFRMSNEISIQDLPYWFYSWWRKFGPNLDYLPENLRKQYFSYQQCHPQLKGSETFIGQSTLYFVAQFDLPWIWAWSFSCNFDDLSIPYLIRRFHYKWWPKYSIEEKLEEVEAIVKQYEEAVIQLKTKRSLKSLHSLSRRTQGR